MNRLRRLFHKPTFQDMVLEFHQKFGALIGDRPMLRYHEVADLRMKLIQEEFDELRVATANNDLVGIADAVADLHYVISGLSVAYGIDENAVFEEVHRSNMTKAYPDGTVRRRSDGKILKSPTYSPADIAGVLRKQGWTYGSIEGGKDGTKTFTFRH